MVIITMLQDNGDIEDEGHGRQYFILGVDRTEQWTNGWGAWSRVPVVPHLHRQPIRSHRHRVTTPRRDRHRSLRRKVRGILNGGVCIGSVMGNEERNYHEK